MNILAPIQNCDDFELLINAGASELYCGYITTRWIELFNHLSNPKWSNMQISLNKRDPIYTNFHEKNSFLRLIEKATKNNIDVYVVVNNTFISENAYSYLNEYFNELKKIGVKNLILSDLGLINFIYNEYPEFKITISCLNQVLNSYAIQFYKQFRIKRIVFPRHIHINEVISIAKSNPNIEFEVFALCEKCIYDDGNCRCIHNIGAICNDCYSKDYYLSKPVIDKKTVYYNTNMFEDWSNTHFFGDEDVEIGCSLCAISNLLSIPNIKSLKVSGRGRWKEDIVVQIQQVRDTINKCKSNTLCSASDIQKEIQEKYGKNFCYGNFHCIMKGE